ncbi:MAG TPA: transglycosylase SLT domain-containing protein [Xanthobacteraceae bacterium]|nr:transglycosylase SLT domain-containing protein [Xanthobacteraceae bacterium]
MTADPISSANAALSQITTAIRQAAQAVGTSFSYLLATAKVESNFDPGEKASTSSAQGLFQFVDQTWLATLKEAGARFGYGDYADAITATPNGRMEVNDPALRGEILRLRNDPAANAAMAGVYTRNNAEYLTEKLGRAPTEGELYMAHFLGAGGAAKLISAANSNVSGEALFPAAARANRSVFYDSQGRARSAGEVYATLNARYAAARARTGPLVAAAAPPVSAKPTKPVPDTAGTVQAFAAGDTTPPLRDSEPVFYALFHTGRRVGALAARVNQLWSVPLPTTQVATADASGRPLDLFQEAQPRVRELFHGQG